MDPIIVPLLLLAGGVLMVAHRPFRRYPVDARVLSHYGPRTRTPSILRAKEKGGCGWHRFITNGEVRIC